VTGGSQEATGTPRSPGEAGFDVPGLAADMDLLPTTPPSAIDATRFAHASEAEMARILDFYQVRWEYEPTTFPILWNLDGDVVESFSPDFFLPEFDLYLEMTTLKQTLVRKKNRKLRRLRELYPDIRIKLFYARDFRAMMLKYGRFGLAQSLSGTSGQLVGGELPRPIADALGVPDGEISPDPTRSGDPAIEPDSGTPPPAGALRRRAPRSTNRDAAPGRTTPAGNRQTETA
jgi:hypoxanthine phosphoribosyltransferase